MNKKEPILSMIWQIIKENKIFFGIIMSLILIEAFLVAFIITFFVTVVV
jgi:hypothetical protein